MKTKLRQSGLTLTEMAVVIGVIALLVGLALPTARVVIESFESGDSTMSMISSALASARALAAREGHYVGVRFQMACDRNAADPLNPLTASQYMILIIHDSDGIRNGTNLANGFRAMEDSEPIKLPDSVGVMDLTVVTRTYPNSYNPEIFEYPIATDSQIDQASEVLDATTFSIVFSPSGKLIIHEAQIRNRDGHPDTKTNTNLSNDDVFNKKAQVDGGVPMFYQDDYCGAWFSPYPDYGLGPEYSRRSFVIYDRIAFRRAFENGLAWSDYLVNMTSEMKYINPNTGTMIVRD